LITKLSLKGKVIVIVIVIVSSESKGKQVVIVIANEDDVIRNHSATADVQQALKNPGATDYVYGVLYRQHDYLFRKRDSHDHFEEAQWSTY
jgi:hypothetical protein